MVNNFFNWSNGRVVIFGLAIAQAIPLIGTFIIAKLYSPSAFGMFALWMGVTTVLATALTGRLELSIVLESDTENRLIAFKKILFTVGLTTTVLMAIMAITGLISDTWNDKTGILVVISLIAACLSSVVQVWQSWLVSDGLYRKLSSSRIVQALAITSAQIVIGYLWPNAVGLASAHTLGLFLSVFILWKIQPFPMRFFNLSFLFSGSLLLFWKKRKNFIIYSLPADIISLITTYLPLFFIANYFGSSMAGIYALAVRIVGGPISLIGTATLDIFKRNAATDFQRNGSCRNLYLSTLLNLVVMSLSFAIIVSIFSDDFFRLAYGEQWESAGNVAIWLLPLFVMKFIASPLSYVFYIFKAQRLDLFWQATLCALTFFIFYYAVSFKQSLNYYAAGYSIMYLINIFLSYKLAIGKTR